MLRIACLALLVALSACAGGGSNKYLKSVEKARQTESKIDRSDDEKFAALCKRYGHLHLYEDFFLCHADLIERESAYLSADYFDLSIRFIAAHIELGNYETALLQVDPVIAELTAAGESLEATDPLFVDLVSLRGVAHALSGDRNRGYQGIAQLKAFECENDKGRCERARVIGSARIAVSLGDFEAAESFLTKADSANERWRWIYTSTQFASELVFPGASLLTIPALYFSLRPVWAVSEIEVDYLYGISLLENEDYKAAYAEFRQVMQHDEFDDYAEIYWSTYSSLGRIKMAEGNKLRQQHHDLVAELSKLDAAGDEKAKRQRKRRLESQLKAKKLRPYQQRMLRRHRIANSDFDIALVTDSFSMEQTADLLEESALADFEKAIEAIELQRSGFNAMAAKIGYVGSKADVYSAAANVLVRQGRDAEAESYRERARALGQEDRLAQAIDTRRTIPEL